MINVLGYLRVSGASQVEGDGLVRQEQVIRAFCSGHGIILGRIFREKGVSGTTEALERMAFVELLEEIDTLNGLGIHIDGIVVERMDRLARDLMVSELLLAECRKRKLKVFSADQMAVIDMAADGGDPTRVLIRQIMGALAQWEKSVLVAKLRTARERKKRETGRCEGSQPFGALPGENETLKVMLSLVKDGWTCTSVARFLNEGGLRNRSGGEWKPNFVRNLVNANKGKSMN